MKKLIIGILAHVDAGKTTCVESMLYTTGATRKLGRVDHRDTVLDFDEEERNHGITIYAKEAHFHWHETEIYVIDTPGHVDFSSEMERSLRVLDFAIMVINGQDGVQSHTETIWQCLQHHHIPCLIFVNKMDISHLSQEELFNDLAKITKDQCILWDDPEKEEKLAMANDELLMQYTEQGTLQHRDIVDAFYHRDFYPVLFGSALKLQNVDGLLNTIDEFARDISYPDEFGARVYKISQDENGNRLTHMKITGGKLVARQKLNEEEKADQIRLYNGMQYQLLPEADAGMIVSVKGLTTSEAGTGYGFEENDSGSLLQAFMNYQLVLPKGANALVLADTMKQLADEDPQLEITVDEHTKQISVQIMGRMQMEILQKKIQERSGILVGFSTGKIQYLETIAEPVYGMGHFEPLRHYAEVHVRIEPGEAGSGVVVQSECSTDVLSNTWQKSILSSLERKRHKGVLTGSSLTDVVITLVAGKGNIKHTTGGDFRQAACRAVRQGLMKAQNILLEPYYDFQIEVPSASLSHALFDMEQRGASVKITELENGRMLIEGEGPVRTLVNYQDELISYTGGSGRSMFRLKGYQPAENPDAIIAEIGYDPESDLYNTADSVFCEHGAGYNVHWSIADEHMHIQWKQTPSSASYTTKRYRVNDADLDYLVKMTAGKNRNPEKEKEKEHVEKVEKQQRKIPVKLPKLLIVDGYNMIYAWDSLKQIAQEDLAGARDELIRDLYNYQPYVGHEIIVVFDAYKVMDNHGSSQKKGALTIVYTKSQETADAWLEKSSYDLKNKYEVTYATSDALIQNAVFSQGAFRMSAKELETVLKMHHVIVRN